MSGTGASNWTFAAQLSDRRERENQPGGETGGKSVHSQPCRENHPDSDGHTQQPPKKQKEGVVLQEKIRMAETMS